MGNTDPVSRGDEPKVESGPVTRMLNKVTSGFSALQKLLVTIAGVIIALGSIFTAVKALEHYFGTPSTTVAFNYQTGIKWADTGVDVHAGATLAITASGSVNLGGPNGPWSPDGWQGCVADVTYHTGNGMPFIAKGMTCFKLIGRIGLNGPVFEVGSHLKTVEAQTGRLFVSVNDSEFDDNTGAWSLTISVS